MNARMWGRQASKSLFSTLGIFAVSVVICGNVIAMEPPSFPSCLVPAGEMKVHYDNGVHGIAGDFGSYTGKDTVYTVADDMELQCFCPPEGQGIQTNWWKIGDMKYKEIEKYKAKGFIFIPTGSVYGLKNEAYLAKNVPFSCMGQPAAPTVPEAPEAPGAPAENLGGPGPGPQPAPGGVSQGGVSQPSSVSAPGAPGLAPTGTLMSIFNTALIGALFMTGGYMLKKGNRS